LIPLCSKIPVLDDWKYAPSGLTKSEKYVGIRNLGCICYMNSMLQQLYHVPAFRYQLLRADDGFPPDMQEYKGTMIDDNLLHQLHRLFGYLELSDRADYNPLDFCFSFKEMDGTPTDTRIQHDTEEFFNIIFNRIENILEPFSQKYLQQSVFGGK
jgi:ubiquitin carboxyl-terminal hydrolase 34